MIGLIQEYWRNYLFTDGYRFTGLAITMWLLVVSIGLGFTAQSKGEVHRGADVPVA